MKNYSFPFDIERQIDAITNLYRVGMGLPPLNESSPAADLREAPLAQEGDRDQGQPSRRLDKAAGVDTNVIPFRRDR